MLNKSGKNAIHGNEKCWEYMKCGREKGGKFANQLGICPSYPNNGRYCWSTAGTLCGGKIQGTFAMKRSTCIDCDFFLKVRKEEGDDFILVDI